MTTWPDDYIDYWADRFVAAGVPDATGISLDVFLLAPHAWLARLKLARERIAVTDRVAMLEPEPPLPRQADVAARLALTDQAADWAEREIRNLPRRNGAAVEKLAHHRYPKSTSDFRAHRGTS